MKSRRIDSADDRDWRRETRLYAPDLIATQYLATRYSVALHSLESLNIEPKPEGKQQHPLLNLTLKCRLTL